MTLFDEEGLTLSRILWNLYQKSNQAHAAINWWITHPINILEWHTNTVSPQNICQPTVIPWK